ncbi:MAG: hypothetical protein WDA00_06775 [Eubacteriales bacterium]
MKKLLCLLCLLPLLVACRHGEAGELLRYQRQELTLSLSFTLGGVACEAEVWLAAGEGFAARDMRLTLTAPDTLAGITVSKTGGACVSTCGSVRLASEHSAFLAPLELFCIEDATLLKAAAEPSGKILTLQDARYTYRISFYQGQTLPYEISRTDGQDSLLVRVQEP